MQITCEKCKTGVMEASKIYRLSGCLVTIGYFLVIPGLLMMAFGLWMTVAAPASVANTSANQLAEIKAEAIKQLKDPSIPGGVAEEFSATRKISDRTMNQLTPDEKQKVSRILSTYNARASGGTIGAGIGIMMGMGFTIGIFIVGLPTFIIGFLLILKRSVWLCPACGYVFDRA